MLAQADRRAARRRPFAYRRVKAGMRLSIDAEHFLDLIASLVARILAAGPVVVTPFGYHENI